MALDLACCKALAAKVPTLRCSHETAAGLIPWRPSSHLSIRIRAEGFAGDITQRTDVRDLAAWLAGTGGVDILIVNTPRPPSPMRDFLDETEDDRWDDAYRKQLDGALSVLRSVTPLLLGKGWGRISRHHLRQCEATDAAPCNLNHISRRDAGRAEASGGRSGAARRHGQRCGPSHRADPDLRAVPQS